MERGERGLLLLTLGMLIAMLADVTLMRTRIALADELAAYWLGHWGLLYLVALGMIAWAIALVIDDRAGGQTNAIQRCRRR